VRQTYFGLDGEPRISTSLGYATEVFTAFDERGWPVEGIYLDEYGFPTNDLNGVHHWAAKRDEKGEILWWRAWNVDGMVVDLTNISP
jgi:hypothetical protein